MSYQLNKTDGSLLTDLVDGQVDKDSTNLVLIGRNYSGYGEFFNENFIKLLENFANTAAPSNPLTGQIWWDTAEQKLKIFNGVQWKATGGPYVQSTQPQMVAGDLWIDNLNNQLYAYDGSDLILIGPPYTQSQGKSGFVIEKIIDTQNFSKTVIKFFINEALVGVFSNDTFTPNDSNKIVELVTSANQPGIIYKGFNVVDPLGFQYRGIALGALALYSEDGATRTIDQFLPTNANGTTSGTLFIKNDGGLTLGASQNVTQKIVNNNFYIESQITDRDISLRVRSTANNIIPIDAIYIKSSNKRVGIFTDSPEYTLDVSGDLRITGDLVVEGNTTNIDVTNLQVQDKNIELAISADSTLNTDSFIDDGGIILKSLNTDKLWTWKQITDSWTSNVNIDLTDSVYKINGQDRLTDTSLKNIYHADDLVSIGTLEELNVDYINFNNSTISTFNSNTPLTLTSFNGITLNPNGNITINGGRIIGISNPINNNDCTNKTYVDTKIKQEPIVFSLDITGLGTDITLQTQVNEYLNDLYPIEDTVSGKIARIHTTRNLNVLLSGIDVDSAKQVSYIAVDSNGTQNESVVQDISFDLAGGSVQIQYERGMMTYQSNGIDWVYKSTIIYPV